MKEWKWHLLENMAMAGRHVAGAKVIPIRPRAS
jgi:hypothetical protein